MLGLIDGDILCYRACFANERAMYSVVDNKGRVLNYEPIRYKKEVLAFLEEKGIDKDEVEIKKEKVVEPPGKVAATVHSIIDYITETLELDDYHIWLSPRGESTFRHKIATIRPYKGNRKEEDRPYHLESCREYLQDKFGAQVIEGYEADDALASEQDGENTVIVSIDKDLYQIVGWHFNFVVEDSIPFYVSPAEALHNKYMQVLTGDSTDNIEGIPGVGSVTAKYLLEELEYSANDDTMEYPTENDYREFTKQLYRKHLKKEYLEQLGMTVDEVYNETLQLVTIRTDVFEREV